MGLSVEEALQLPGMAGTGVAAGGAGLDRVVRHMVVDNPTDPLALAGPDVIVVLGARLPPADPANCRALVERLDSMGTAALAFRRADGPPPVPGEVLAEAERRGFPVLALPAGIRIDEVVSEVLGAVVAKQSEALALSSRMHNQFIDVALSGGGLAEVTAQLADFLEGAAVLGLGPDREIVTSAGPPDDVAEISDWLWLLDAAADDALAELAPSRRLSGVRADQSVVTPADVLADADLSRPTASCSSRDTTSSPVGWGSTRSRRSWPATSGTAGWSRCTAPAGCPSAPAVCSSAPRWSARCR